MSNVLEVNGLTVQLPASADRPNAVEDISFSVAKGEIVCVVGESGSGKSVTAQAVMGLLPRELKPIQGETLLEGEDTIQAVPTRLRRSAALRSVWISRTSAIWSPTRMTGLSTVIGS